MAYGEEPLAAMAREIREETHLVVDDKVGAAGRRFHFNSSFWLVCGTAGGRAGRQQGWRG